MRSATMCCSCRRGPRAVPGDRSRAVGDPLHLALQRQDADGDLRGEVLVGDRDLASLPSVADEPQRRGDDLVIDLGRRELGIHRFADRDLRRSLVTGEKRVCECPAQLADPRRVSVTRVVVRMVAHRLRSRPIPARRRGRASPPIGPLVALARYFAYGTTRRGCSPSHARGSARRPRRTRSHRGSPRRRRAASGGMQRSGMPIRSPDGGARRGIKPRRGGRPVSHLRRGDLGDRSARDRLRGSRGPYCAWAPPSLADRRRYMYGRGLRRSRACAMASARAHR